MKLTDEIVVVASDDETFDKYGDEIDFTMEVEWDESTLRWKSETSVLLEFVGAKLKQAHLNGEPMPITNELEKFAIKKLSEGWFKATNKSKGYSGKILEIWNRRNKNVD